MAKEKTGGQKAARRRQRKKKGGITAKRKKEFTFRGYTMEELLEMPFDEMVLLLPARARRTLTRDMNDEQRIAFEVLKNENREVTRTHRRDVPIIPQFVGKKVAVYNGKEFIEFEIKPEMIGHFTGEFAMTRSEVKHSGPGVGATRGSKFLPLK
ncbi:MAG TPA: 30S ribosomal protein S19 [Methanomassiliicoccaceae archaeon]|jgi:small subunit ribosomal protein S19|nr:30S ribosomal protein S19 [Euryarchaeota archaeon]HOB38329.1 30S ribosomal protein S19 [Methanomassiliicoccaceae archaeon]HOK28178.1 30S ribosomal protein S19 [Methanomassiliicoccaceae archaeon]HPT74777.1 30S ribosomal protein S19 [Methanomassiliicoccaceae archaeon]HQA20460.1 30S ribosomal protein S19 [Methanomassiliicoccaceae archaeon]